MRRIALIALAVALVGCAPDPTSPEEGSNEPHWETADTQALQTSLDEATGLEAVADNCHRMGLDALAAMPEENVVFSPTSWCMMLGMLGSGATGDAAAQTEAALGASGDDANTALNALITALAAFEGDPADVDTEELPAEPVVHRAAQLVVDTGFETKPEYVETLGEFYDSGLLRADLSDEATKEVLDEWVQEHTGGLVEESAIQPSEDLLLALQDALFFASAWSSPFPEPSGEMDFTNSDGSVASLPLVTELRRMDYAEVNGWQAAQIPYDGGFVATFYLPTVDGDDLTPDLRDQLLEAMEPVLVDFAMPEFSLASTTEVLPLMAEQWDLGAYGDPNAKPLEGIQEGQGLAVGEVTQQARIDVTSTGTVAAAVTETAVTGTSNAIPDETLHLTRPFHMTITHEESGVDLFQVAARQLESTS